MKRCFELALRGTRKAAPNPMVGSVIVHRNKIIGEGYHQQYGGPHAEVNAIKNVNDTSLLKEATLYVNLEPCAHQGKTPPCSNLIIGKGIPKVVIANTDPHEKVYRKGISRLKAQGCEVVLGVGAEEGREVNKRFFTYHEKKRPYIVLKWAQTQDGFFDSIRETGSKTKINWISQPETQQLVHTWRYREQAVLVGTRTVLNDNPKLTVRKIRGIHPLRIAIDRKGIIPSSFSIYDGEAPTLIYQENIADVSLNGTRKKSLDFEEDVLPQIMNDLYQREILSVLVEGGAHTLQSFIDRGLWDEARVIVGHTHFKTGLAAPVLPDLVPVATSFGKDRILWYKPLN